MTSTVLTFYTDPGHGWLEVPLHEMRASGLEPRDFTRYSYRRRNVFYLEEDCDAPKFIDAWKRKFGNAPAIIEKMDGGFVRGLPPIWS